MFSGNCFILSFTQLRPDPKDPMCWNLDSRKHSGQEMTPKTCRCTEHILGTDKKPFALWKIYVFVSWLSQKPNSSRCSLSSEMKSENLGWNRDVWSCLNHPWTLTTEPLPGREALREADPGLRHLLLPEQFHHQGVLQKARHQSEAGVAPLALRLRLGPRDRLRVDPVTQHAVAFGLSLLAHIGRWNEKLKGHQQSCWRLYILFLAPNWRRLVLHQLKHLRHHQKSSKPRYNQWTNF